MDINRILVIQLERLGDLVQTTPLLIDLHRAHPNASIDVLAWKEFAPIMDGMPGVTLHTITGRRVKELNDDIESGLTGRARQAVTELGLTSYDWIINVTHSRFSAWLNGHLNATRRDGGYLNEAGEWLYGGDWLTLLVAMAEIRRENRFNIADLYRACAGAGGVSKDARGHVVCDEHVPFELPEGAFAVLAPGANESQRRFSLEHILPVLTHLSSLGFKIVLVGGPGEETFSKFPLIDLTGRTDVRQLAHVLGRAAIVLAADSAAAHIAAALGRPLVALYGGSLAPLTTAPWGAGHVVLVANSMEKFSSDLIVAALRARLNASAEGELRRETLSTRTEAWKTAMLVKGEDPLGGVTYLPLHTDRLEPDEIARRRVRHVMAAAIMGKDLAVGPPAEWEQQLSALAVDVGRGRSQLAQGRFEGLPEIGDRVTATIRQLREASRGTPLAPIILFLDWKLRVMPAYEPERIFEENERELVRAVKMLRMIRGFDV